VGASLEVADIVRRYGDRYRLDHPVSLIQRRVLRAIEQCSTFNPGFAGLPSTGALSGISSAGFPRPGRSRVPFEATISCCTSGIAACR
jgi:hypothetical protein